MIRITDNHGPRLLRMDRAAIMPALGEELAAAAQSIVDVARQNINDGGIPSPHHVASAPGEYPNSDTHELEQSLRVGEVVETQGQVQASAIADAPCAGYLEHGTSRMEPRPFMTPSTEEVRPTVLPALGARYVEIVNG